MEILILHLIDQFLHYRDKKYEIVRNKEKAIEVLWTHL